MQRCQLKGSSYADRPTPRRPHRNVRVRDRSAPETHPCAAVRPPGRKRFRSRRFVPKQPRFRPVIRQLVRITIRMVLPAHGIVCADMERKLSSDRRSPGHRRRVSAEIPLRPKALNAGITARRDGRRRKTEVRSRCVYRRPVRDESSDC